MLPVSLDCPYLIVPSGYVVSVSGLNILQSRDTGNITRRDNQVWTIQRHWQHNPKGQSGMDNLDYPFGLCCQCLWIVHTWLYLRVIFPVSLDCPYLIVSSGYICSVSRLSILQSRDTDNITRRDNQVWTIQRHWQHNPKGQSSMDNPETLAIWVPDNSARGLSLRVMLPVSLDCPYLIVPSGYVVSVSGLNILDCPFGLYCQCLWIVHTWLPLRSGQSRDTGNITRRDNQVWTIQRHWQYNPKGQLSMDNPETLAT
jgi:hypothetical protein